MAKLFELAKIISPSVVHLQQANVIRQRVGRAETSGSRRAEKYEKRMDKVCANAFDVCKQARPQRKRYHNTLFREQMGTVGESVVTKRFAGSYITSVCRTKIY